MYIALIDPMQITPTWGFRGSFRIRDEQNQESNA